MDPSGWNPFLMVPSEWDPFLLKDIFHCDAEIIALLIGDSRCIKLSFCHKDDEVKATAKIALDGLGRYADTSAMKPIGKSLMCRVSAAVRRRLLAPLFDTILHIHSIVCD